MTQWKNIGTVSNRGWEISLDYDIIANRKLRWNVGLDATFLKNKIVKLPEGKDILNGSQNFSEGHSIYEFYTYHYVGVDQLNGNALYTIDPEKAEAASNAGALATINGTDYTYDTTYAKRDWAGSALPDGSFKPGVEGLFTECAVHLQPGWQDNGWYLPKLDEYKYSLVGRRVAQGYPELLERGTRRYE